MEVDPGWWNSKYAPPRFLPLHFVKHDEIMTIEQDSALLFCYFNNERVFNRYMEHYLGHCLIIIGPGKDRGAHCNPEPFQLQNHPDWKLSASQEIRDTGDFIAIYRRHDHSDVFQT